MQSTCPNCNKPVSPNDQVCKSCGFDLSPENTGVTIVRLVAVVLLILTVVSLLCLLAYGSINRYLTVQGVITTPLFWRPTSTITNTVTLTVTTTSTKTRVPRPTITPTLTDIFTTTPTETLTATLVPTSTITPSYTPTITPIPSKTKRPTSTPRPSATVKATSAPSATTGGTNPTATTGATNPTASPTGGSGPTATVGSLSDPAEFLRAYYTLINNRTYQQAWTWLSPGFIASKSTELGRAFSYEQDYVAYWDTVNNLEILLVTTESSTADTAVVNMQIRYNMKDGTSNVYKQRMGLIKSATQTWLIDSNQVTQ